MQRSDAPGRGRWQCVRCDAIDTVLMETHQSRLTPIMSLPLAPAARASHGTTMTNRCGTALSTARVRALILLALAAMPSVALAQEPAQGDPSQGTGPLPNNVAPSPTPICTDRPTRASVACTVPAGAFQLETDFIDWTRETLDGVRTDTILYTNPTLKYGVSKHTDVEVNIAPYQTVRTRMADGSVTTDGGVGDLFVRAKQRLTADSSMTHVAVIGSVKAPTAGSVVGNGKWEGSVALPVNIPLPAKFTLTTSPEFDISANQGSPNQDPVTGHHFELVNLINLSHPVGKNATVYAEFWTKESFEPRHNTQQYSADLAASYQLTKTLQLDAAAYIGLNRETPGLQLYTGLSTRF
ncbi:transporter [Sphingomonas sp. 10B4]|uniref:transporter n=2 Tax=Sphingomonas sp. 10B4 TaxID=3048575 RepID=UPI002B22BC9D|nr:transporter [Sphingomonas sp. 10B4]